MSIRQKTDGQLVDELITAYIKYDNLVDKEAILARIQAIEKELAFPERDFTLLRLCVTLYSCWNAQERIMAGDCDAGVLAQKLNAKRNKLIQYLDGANENRPLDKSYG